MIKITKWLIIAAIHIIAVPILTSQTADWIFSGNIPTSVPKPKATSAPKKKAGNSASVGSNPNESAPIKKPTKKPTPKKTMGKNTPSPPSEIVTSYPRGIPSPKLTAKKTPEPEPTAKKKKNGSKNRTKNPTPKPTKKPTPIAKKETKEEKAKKEREAKIKQLKNQVAKEKAPGDLKAKKEEENRKKIKTQIKTENEAKSKENALAQNPNPMTKIGDPVVATSGAFYNSKTDFEYSYFNDSIKIKRSHNSQNGSGKGWSFNYDTRIIQVMAEEKKYNEKLKHKTSL